MTARDQASSPAAAKTVATNRKARRDYYVLETYEAGIELRGTEVKSVRAGRASLGESYGRVENGQVILYDLHIMPYEHGNVFNHDPKRPKRLLLHQREIHRLFGQVAVKGQALIPLRLYLKHGLVKVEVGLCRGKLFEDKRETLRRRTADREAERAIAEHRRR